MLFFQPSSSERRGLMVLCGVLLLAGAALWLLPRREASEQASPTRAPRYAPRASRSFAQPERRVETFPFDPNTADSAELLRLGLTPAMVRGVYKYRSMGYTYSDPSDFSRVPGMTNGLWERLAPCIRIGREFRRVVPSPRPSRGRHADLTVEAQPLPPRDTVRYPVKLAPGMRVELNGSDTTALKKIPGVGSYYARQIVRYRQQLGGFISLEQLEEIEGIPEGLADYLTLDTTGIRRIEVNRASKNTLVRHPYLRVYRARAVWDHRRKYGPLRSLDDLRSLPDFSEEDIRRLEPYLDFR